MRTNKRGFFGGVLLATVLVAAQGAACPQKTTIRVATPFPAGHILSDTALKFKEILESKSHGRIEVTVASAVLNEQTIDPQMTSCDATARVADIMLTGGQALQDWAPAYFFFNGPYVIIDYDHFLRVWNSELGEGVRELFRENANLDSLGTVYRGFRQFTSNKPITAPADFVGLKLRLPPTPDWVAVWSTLGVTPVTVPLTGIYDALRTGTAEASEGDLTQIASLNLKEVQSHLTFTNHLVGFGLALANECFLTSLRHREEHQVRWAMREAVEWGTAQMVARESTLLASLEADPNGMTVVTPDADAIRAAAKPAIDNLFATKWTVTTWADVLAK